MAALDDRQSWVGRTIDQYQVLSLVGAGGMGVVYRARDTKLGRDIALKVLPEEYSHDHDRIIRLEREARLLASLNHPNIAAIYDLKESEGSRCLILEYVSQVFVSAIYAALGENDRALICLEEAYEDRCSWLLRCLSGDQRLDGLRNEPRFIRLVERVGGSQA